MIREGVTVVDAEHQEEHQAADKQLPSVRSAQCETFGINTRKVMQKTEQAEAPD